MIIGIIIILVAYVFSILLAYAIGYEKGERDTANRLSDYLK